jgi:hypothetical protein
VQQCPIQAEHKLYQAAHAAATILWKPTTLGDRSFFTQESSSKQVKQAVQPAKVLPGSCSINCHNCKQMGTSQANT